MPLMHPHVRLDQGHESVTERILSAKIFVYRILEIVNRRGLIGQLNRPKYGVIMQEMTPPFKPQNMALSRAVSKGHRLKPGLIQALERWLHDNRNV